MGNHVLVVCWISYNVFLTHCKIQSPNMALHCAPASLLCLWSHYLFLSLLIILLQLHLFSCPCNTGGNFPLWHFCIFCSLFQKCSSRWYPHGFPPKHFLLFKCPSIFDPSLITQLKIAIAPHLSLFLFSFSGSLFSSGISLSNMYILTLFIVSLFSH